MEIEDFNLSEYFRKQLLEKKDQSGGDLTKKMLRRNFKRLLEVGKKEKKLEKFFKNFIEKYSSNGKSLSFILIQRKIKGIKKLKMLENFSFEEIQKIGLRYLNTKETNNPQVISLNDFKCFKCKKTQFSLFEFILHWITTHSQQELKVFTTKKSKSDPRKILIFAVESDYNMTSFPCTQSLSAYKKKNLKGFFQLNILISKIQRIFIEEEITNFNFLKIKRWEKKPPTHEILARGMTLNIGNSGGLNLVHSNPHGLPFRENRANYLEETAESEDFNFQEFDQNCVEFNYLFKENTIFTTLVKHCFNIIMEEVDKEKNKFDSSYSLLDLNTFFVKRKMKISIYELIERFSKFPEFENLISSFLIAMLFKGIIDKEYFCFLATRIK